MPGYELTALAEEDLRAIARYTVNTWGIEQAKHYEALLLKRLQELSQGNIHQEYFQKTDQIYCLRIVNIIIFSIGSQKIEKSQLFWQFCMNGWISCKDLRIDWRHKA